MIAHHPHVELSEEVLDALNEGRGVVALESTILAHGLPYPDNLELAGALEGVIRDRGAVPATIAVIGGSLKAGLSELELEEIATKPCLKLSRRDLPYAMLKRQNGATTVASTMLIAAAAGIRLFATGGIGGVHRDFQFQLDISADLHELAQTSVAVVTAGAKAILDIGNTLEYLETMSVPVIGYRCDDFPAFYSRTSGHKVPFRLDEVEDVARFLQLKWDSGIKGGVVIANSIPESSAIPQDVVEELVERALAEAAIAGIRGKELTPFLLAKLVQLSGGQSLSSNKVLALHNASLAAEIAVAYNS